MTCSVGRARLLGVLRRRHGVELQQTPGDVAFSDLGVVAILEERLVLDDDERVGLGVHGDRGHLDRSAGIASTLDCRSHRGGVRLDARTVVEDRDESIRSPFAADRVDGLTLRIVEPARVVGCDVADDTPAKPGIDLLATHGPVGQRGEQ